MRGNLREAARFMNRRMEIARELRFAEKTVLDLFVVDLAGFDRDLALDERIPAPIDGPEAAHSDLLGDLVFPDFFEHGSVSEPRKCKRTESSRKPFAVSGLGWVDWAA